MKRILLINPNTEQAPYPVAPVGLCIIAAALKDKFEVRIFDGTFSGAADLRETVDTFSPDYIGVGIRNIDDVTLGTCRFYIDEIRRDFIDPIRQITRAPIILGGAGFNLFPEVLVKELGADFGVTGEGEFRFAALLDALESGRRADDLEGVVTTAAPPLFERRPTGQTKLLEIPFSTVDAFIDFKPYRARGSYPVQSKRGCHLNCVYCSYPLIEGREYRLRPPVQIVDEIEQAAERLGAVTFEFVDSTFNAPLAHAKAICREILRRNLKVRLRSMGVNPGTITDSLLDLMRRAGFAQIVCSADTAAAATLGRYQKGFTRKKLEVAATLIRKHDMPAMWSFIFGGPGETEATIDESFDFIDRFVNPLDMVHMVEGMRIYPHTPIYKIALQEGVIGPSDTLLKPVFYLSPALGEEKLSAILLEKSKTHLNCIPAAESDPGPELMQKAVALRIAENLEEPMFRTLLRLRRAAT